MQVHVRTHTCIHTHTHTHVHTHTHITHIQTHIHKHTHTNTHTHTHTRKVCISTQSYFQYATVTSECILQAGADFVSRSGLTGFPHVIINGIPMDKKYLSQDSFEEGVVMEILKQTPVIQKAVFNVGTFFLLETQNCSVYLLCVGKQRGGFFI